MRAESRGPAILAWPRLASVPLLSGDADLIVISLSKPTPFRGNSWKPILAFIGQKRLICRYFGAFWKRQQLIAMQKVEGSNPFSRS
jgi:hypothetical protein